MDCVYCEKGERLDSFAIKIGELSASIVYLQKEQSYYGRCMLVLKEHKEEIYELSEAEWLQFMKEVKLVAGAMNELYAPDKINCGLFGDTVRHIHVHLVPKRKGELDWNGVFQLNANKKYLEADEYQQMVAAYREKLGMSGN